VRILQTKGQEIVDKKLSDSLRAALESYKKLHPLKQYPDHFILYRDGVGDAMRKMVLDKEISQIREAIS